MRRGTDALETINAAATVIASTENRAPQASKRRWGSCWGDYWCFGTYKTKRIGHAIESSTTETNEAQLPLQSPSMDVPFVAPPSSPASFLPSEPPSATQSPTNILSLSVHANMYSPGGPNSIFATGPYAHETQLVSPPVFSSFTTEPSTAPYTPPPESVHLTATPSSPEVPFARLLEPMPNLCPMSQNEFQSYQFQPGSPVSHLISPSSGISGSGTSSPFLDRDLAAGVHPFFLQFRTGDAPKLFLDLDRIVHREFGGSGRDSGSVTPGRPLDRQDSDVGPIPGRDSSGLVDDDGTACERRVSFDMTDEVIRCAEKETTLSSSPKPEANGLVKEEKPIFSEGETSSDTTETERKHQRGRTFTLGSAKEFIFDNIDGVVADEPRNGSSDWWANEKIATGRD